MLSVPSVAPSRPKRLGSSWMVEISSEMPSSPGWGEDQLRISSIQLCCIPATPMVGITAIGFPSSGNSKNQGRVGLCQNWVRNPLK